MEFFGYDTRIKLIWESGEGIININKISRQGSPTTNINKVSPSSTFIFCCSPHKDTCNKLLEYLVLCIFQSYSFKKIGGCIELYKEG